MALKYGGTTSAISTPYTGQRPSHVLVVVTVGVQI
jgi:hypothetical protein